MKIVLISIAKAHPVWNLYVVIAAVCETDLLQQFKDTQE